MPEILAPSTLEQLLAERLGPVVEDSGLPRIAGVRFPAWGRPRSDGGWLFLNVQVDAKANDAWAGPGFRLELEIGTVNRPCAGVAGRALFFQLLQADELSTVLAHQNRVVGALHQPPDAHLAVYPAGDVRDMYKSYFAPQDRFDAVRSWLRCPTPDDVATWVKILAPLVPPMLHRAERYLDKTTIHLGKGSLLDN